jgi:predicted transcriptional regulator
LKIYGSEPLWERRDRHKIFAEIMEFAKESQLKTRIMYMVNLSYTQVNEYLSELTKIGFLRTYREDGKKYYETTTKGNLYIENYFEMANLLRPKELEVPILMR